MGLAGPRIKQRISADPRNLAWSNDQTKFGYKMLSKMGWSPGKGLGINEDGEKEHIKLSIKQDNLGIGATKKTTDNWLDNSSAFDELLKGLNDKFQTGEKEEREKLEMDEKDKGSKQDSDNKTKVVRVKPKKNKKKNNNQNKKSISNLQLLSSSSTFTLSNNNEPTANTSDSGSLSSIRLAHRAKFLKSKKAAIQNSDRLNEIFGIKSNKNSIDNFSSKSISTKSMLSSSSSDNDGKDSEEKIRKVDIITKVNEMSTNEYFAQKMKGLKIASTCYNKTNDDVDERPSFKQDANISNTSSKGLRFISNDDNSKSNKKRKIDNDNVNDSGDSGDYKSIKSNKKSKKKEMRKKKKKNKS